MLYHINREMGITKATLYIAILEQQKQNVLTWGNGYHVSNLSVSKYMLFFVKMFEPFLLLIMVKTLFIKSLPFEFYELFYFYFVEKDTKSKLRFILFNTKMKKNSFPDIDLPSQMSIHTKSLLLRNWYMDLIYSAVKYADGQLNHCRNFPKAFIE